MSHDKDNLSTDFLTPNESALIIVIIYKVYKNLNLLNEYI